MLNLRKHCSILALISAFGITALPSAIAQTPGVTTLTGASYDTTGQFTDFSIGYNFTVGAQDITVTAFGYLDDGFGSAHKIGIFDAANTLVGNESAVAVAGADGNSARADAANPTRSARGAVSSLSAAQFGVRRSCLWPDC